MSSSTILRAISSCFSTAEYPDIFYERLRQSICSRLIIFIVLFALSGVAFYGSLSFDKLLPVASILFVAFIMYTIGCVGWLVSRFKESVCLLYFKQPLEDYSGYLPGIKAHVLNVFDKIAVEKEVLPLSGFGFCDDNLGQQMVWHNAEDLQETIDVLLKATNVDPEHIIADSGLDLKAMSEMLSIAYRKNIPCALIFSLNGSQVASLQNRCGYFR